MTPEQIKQFDKEWQENLSKVTGHGDGIIGDVRPFIKSFISKLLEQQAKSIIEDSKLMSEKELKKKWL